MKKSTSIFKWPRGKYNGQRIIGFFIKFALDVRWWGFFLPTKYNRAFKLGPFIWRWGYEYDTMEGNKSYD